MSTSEIDLKVEIIKLNKKIKILENGLEFYADKMNWNQIINNIYNLGKIWIETSPMSGMITTENGIIARMALRLSKKVR